MGRKAKDLTGMEFGYLTVMYKNGNADTSGHVLWTCRCALCWSLVSVRSDKLLNGRAISCGCWRKNRWKTEK